MRIPVYRSQAQRSNEAPGRSITARKRAEPFIQAELQKGDAIGEAFSQVQQYALMRQKAAVEVQMSESLLAAEEEMMTLANQLKESPDIYNVFKADGTGLWSDNMSDMRERLADRIESRSARNEFRARFNQSELSKRFQLRDEVDRRIKARANAAAAARMKAIEDNLSKPFGPTPDDYNMAGITVATNAEAEIRSGTASPEMSAAARSKLAINIATRTVQSYVFDDPNRAVALAEALDLQDEVNRGDLTAEEAYARSGLSDDAGYTLFTLQAIPREQALEIIYDVLGRSSRLANAAQARYESDARALGSRIDTARTVLSSGGVVGPEALADMTAEAIRLRSAQPELLAAIEKLSADYDFISNIRGMNRIELEAELERYTGGMLGVGEAGIDTPEEVYRREVVARALDATVRAEAAATAEARAAAAPALRLIETSAEVLDSVMSSPTPNPLIAEEAMAQLLESYRDLPPEIITEDMRESMAEVQQTMAALESWRENQPAENMAELERLRSAIPSTDDLPPGVDLIDQIAINQRQANLLSGFMTAQQNALAGGQGLAYARSQGVLIDNPAFDAPVVVGEPIDLTGDPSAVRASLDQRFREVNFVETRFGTIGQNVLLPQEVALIENILSEGQPGQRVVILGMIADQGADRAERIFRSLDLDNPEMRLYSHIGSLMTSGNERAASLALRGMEVEQPPALTDMEVSRAFRAQVGAAFAYLPYTAEAMRETARFIYAEAASRDPDLAEMIRPNAWENSMSLAMGDLKIETINRNPVLMETIVSPDLVEDWLADPTSMPNIVVNDLELEEYSFDVLNQGRWYPVAVGQDQYQLRTGEGVDSAPWADNNGRPVLVSLYRLSTIMSYPGDAGR
jgi:hypothetical protein